MYIDLWGSHLLIILRQQNNMSWSRALCLEGLAIKLASFMMLSRITWGAGLLSAGEMWWYCTDG